MLVQNSIIIFSYLLISYCETSFVDSLTKCSIKDNDCQRSTYQNVINEIGKTGVPELNLPRLDPLELKNISMTVLDTVTMTLVDGVAKGIRSCGFNSFIMKLETLTAFYEIVCDITIEGLVTVSGKNPEVQSALGLNNLNSQASGKVKIDKLKVKYEVPFIVYKKNDLYMKVQIDAVKFTHYDVGNAKFFAKNIIVGGADLTQIILPYMNQNWRMFLDSIAPVFLDIGTKTFFNVANYFFTSVPLNKYIIEDLSSYIKH